MVAERGFEPPDLRVMSPTSYQTAPLRDIGCSCLKQLLYSIINIMICQGILATIF